ncbi:hypothetical protein AYM40_04520 [Paraburkholderia phytofirmans OLGA172]|uniref:Uncharacterized protein n=1 Tax=Paraburkholderia phytofirmans OLGA172 TaxID=1417228 RepID=A0A160FHQ9_9BURK|nr:hypothetical protein AYM40_04520 [Paraburkholderia phytofirmans OLGA172]
MHGSKQSCPHSAPQRQSRQLFFTDGGSHAGLLSDLTQAYLRPPSKHRASPVKLDGLRFGASVIR